MNTKRKIVLAIVIVFILIVIAFAGFIIFAHGDSTVICENDLGTVTKANFSHYDNPTVKIGVISGMHPREKLHQFALPVVCWIFSITHNVEIINYQVNVTQDADLFSQSRANGESLVHDYVVEDIADSDLDLVIIGHDHEEGYGEGYYIATPTMDNASVNLAADVTSVIGFKHYTRDKNSSTKSTSIKNVDNPIVDTGTKVFVYEIPENDNKISALKHSYDLLSACYDYLT